MCLGGNYSTYNIEGELVSLKELISPDSDCSVRGTGTHWTNEIQDRFGGPHSSERIF